MANPLEAILGLLLVFFIPGYLLVCALFPRRGELDLEFDQLYRITLGMGLSIVLAILIGFGLNALGTNPSTGLGYLQAATLWLAFTLASLGLFLVGWWRGAYPILGRLHASLLRLPRRDPRSLLAEHRTPREILETEALLSERKELLARIQRYEEKTRLPRETIAAHYRQRRREAQERVAAINARLSELERRRAGRREDAR